MRIVQRVLPDQIIIKVVEREPIGLAGFSGEIYQFDADAKILEPDPLSRCQFSDPGWTSARTTRSAILQKVEIYRKVLEELGQTALSEIHINDHEEVTVVSASDPLIVNLGAVGFSQPVDPISATQTADPAAISAGRSRGSAVQEPSHRQDER